MATKTYLFTGKTKWAKVRKPDETYDNYQIPVYLDDENMNLFKDSGIQTKIKEDDDGEFVTFKRRHSEFNYAKKEQQVNGPPEVFLKNADGTYEPWPDGLIGNGSTVTVKVDVYDTRNGKGHRLLSVGVDDLVEYNAVQSAGGNVSYPF